MTCAYCGRTGLALEPEHPIPRSIGGDAWEISACRCCNRLANRLIDDQLRHCSFIREARAKSGLCKRDGTPYTYELVGSLMLLKASGPPARHNEDLIARVKQAESLGVAGGRVSIEMSAESDLKLQRVSGFAESIDGRRRAFSTPEPGDGSFTIAHRVESVDDPAELNEGDQGFIIFEGRHICGHSDATWKRFTAKSGLALLNTIENSAGTLESGTPVAQAVGTRALQRLRLQFRDTAFAAGTHSPDTEPMSLRLPELRSHYVLIDSDQAGGARITVVLFGTISSSLIGAGVPIREPISCEIPIRRLQERCPASAHA